MLLSRVSRLDRVKPTLPTRRTYIVLGIETSCDDTSVCLYDRYSREMPPKLLASLKVSTDNSEDGGIVPTKALSHHQANLAMLTQKLMGWQYPLHPTVYGNALKNISALHPSESLRSPTPSNPNIERKRVTPDLICVTRGPGMRGSLAAGTEFAKGLAVAYNIPVIGVHHMLGHLLSPRLTSQAKKRGSGGPEFPYITMLASGGHTMLVLSKSLTDHEILADTADIAIGDAIEKCARFIGLKMDKRNSYGPSLEAQASIYKAYLEDQHRKQSESLAGELISSEQSESPAEELKAEEFKASEQPESLAEELTSSEQPESPAEEIASSEQPEAPAEELKSLSLNVAMRNKGTRVGSSAFSFAGYLSMVERRVQEVFGGNLDDISELQRAKIAYEIQQAMFTQIVERVQHTINTKLDADQRAEVKHIVLAGGVASNRELRIMFRRGLQTYTPEPGYTGPGRGLPRYDFIHARRDLCTDNADMIAWAGIELWETLRLRTELDMQPVPEWPLENFTTNVDCWTTEAMRGGKVKLQSERKPSSGIRPPKPYSQREPKSSYYHRGPQKPYSRREEKNPTSKLEELKATSKRGGWNARPWKTYEEEAAEAEAEAEAAKAKDSPM